MTTDGGGYILIGKKNSSVTWTVPSNDFPVEPFGDPHWASNLGDIPIRDFRIQIATVEDLQQTKAHWFVNFDIWNETRNKAVSRTLFGYAGGVYSYIQSCSAQQVPVKPNSYWPILNEICRKNMNIWIYTSPQIMWAMALTRNLAWNYRNSTFCLFTYSCI